jgi:hypothetical protein
VQGLPPFQVMPGYTQMELSTFDTDESTADRDGPQATDGSGEGGSRS